MAKFLPALCCCLLGLLSTGRAENALITELKRNGSVDEFKAVMDRAQPGDVKAVDDVGRTALFYSRQFGTLMLLLAGADPNARDDEGRTPAFRAVSRSGDVAFPMVLDMLAMKGADLNAHDKNGYTVLAWAVHEENEPAVRMLLAFGANPAPQDVPGNQTPLFFALQQQNDKLANLLRGGTSARNSIGEGDVSPDQRFAAAALGAHLSALNAALADGANINARDKDGATTLYRAVAERRANVVAFLLVKGANPNLANNDGRSPLMQCTTGYDMPSERMLVDLIVAGADINAAAKDGTTALSESVHSSNNTSAQWMIWRGAKLDVHTPNGTLAQEAAAHTDWLSMIPILKNAGIKDGFTPLPRPRGEILIEAVQTGNSQALEAALNSGIPADARGKHDQTALEWAEMYDRFDYVDLLIRRGADINHQHVYNGENILHTLGGKTRDQSSNAPELIEKILQRGGNPNLTLNDGSTPLMVAARNGVTGRTLELLLQATANVNARDKQNMTALALARQHGHGETARALGEHGATE